MTQSPPRTSRNGSDERLPPHSYEAEQGVLGCVIDSAADCYPAASDKIRSDDTFYDTRHQTIWATMRSMANNGGIDALTLGQKLRDSNQLEAVGGLSYLTELVDAIPSAKNLPHYLKIVDEKYRLRRMIHACDEVVSRAYENPDDIEDFLESTRPALTELYSGAASEQENWSVNQLISYDIANDPNAIIGMKGGVSTRYLCKGYGAWIIGQCLHADTPIFDPTDGTSITVKQRCDSGLPFHVYAMGPKGVVVTTAEPPKRFAVRNMLRFHFSNGDSIAVTMHHRFLTTVGYRRARDVASELDHGRTVTFPSIRNVVNGPEVSTVSATAWNWESPRSPYYDFHVPIHKNYYACGVFNHNSHVGKSSLTQQMSFLWAIGKAFCGMVPVRPLRILIVQAENDIGDIAESTQGILESIPDVCPAIVSQIHKNVRVTRCRGKTGANFCRWLQREIQAWSADVVFVDPLLRFAGIDVSRQDQCTRFLNDHLDPVLSNTGVVMIGAHHTGKPRSAKETKDYTVYDLSYAGIGSSDLVNWARAISVIRVLPGGVFEMVLSKRGARAWATHPNGVYTTSIFLKHSEKKIYWEQVDPPPIEDPDRAPREPKKSKVDEVATSNLYEFCAACKPAGEGKNELAKRLETWLAKTSQDVSIQSCKRIINALVANGKISKGEDGLYRKGSQA